MKEELFTDAVSVVGTVVTLANTVTAVATCTNRFELAQVFVVQMDGFVPLIS